MSASIPPSRGLLGAERLQSNPVGRMVMIALEEDEDGEHSDAPGDVEEALKEALGRLKNKKD